MSLSCPQCGSALGGDFGVVVCLNCRAVCSIDLDGQIQTASESGAQNPFETPVPEALEALQASEANSISQAEPESSELVPKEERNVGSDELPQAPQAELSDLLVQELAEVPALDMNLEHEYSMEKWAQSEISQAGLTPVDNIPTEAPVTDAFFGEASDNSKSPTEQFAPEATAQVLETAGAEPTRLEPTRTHHPDLSLSEELKAFAEKDSDQGFAWTYDLEIHCLGSTTSRQKLESLLATPYLSLKDADMEWDETLNRMFLKELNPAQAAVLQKELESLRVQLIWRQNVLSIGSHDAFKSQRQRGTKDA